MILICSMTYCFLSKAWIIYHAVTELSEKTESEGNMKCEFKKWVEKEKGKINVTFIGFIISPLILTRASFAMVLSSSCQLQG